MAVLLFFLYRAIPYSKPLVFEEIRDDYFTASIICLPPVYNYPLVSTNVLFEGGELSCTVWFSFNSTQKRCDNMDSINVFSDVCKFSLSNYTCHPKLELILDNDDVKKHNFEIPLYDRGEYHLYLSAFCMRKYDSDSIKFWLSTGKEDGIIGPHQKDKRLYVWAKESLDNRFWIICSVGLASLLALFGIFSAMKSLHDLYNGRK